MNNKNELYLVTILTGDDYNYHYLFDTREKCIDFLINKYKNDEEFYIWTEENYEDWLEENDIKEGDFFEEYMRSLLSKNIYNFESEYGYFEVDKFTYDEKHGYYN